MNLVLCSPRQTLYFALSSIFHWHSFTKNKLCCYKKWNIIINWKCLCKTLSASVSGRLKTKWADHKPAEFLVSDFLMSKHLLTSHIILMPLGQKTYILCNNVNLNHNPFVFSKTCPPKQTKELCLCTQRLDCKVFPHRCFPLLSLHWWEVISNEFSQCISLLSVLFSGKSMSH